MLREFAENYKSKLIESIDKVPFDQLEAVVNQIIRAFKEQRKIFVMGNGGSAATASHFVCDFAKGCAVKGSKKFKIIGLTDNIPIITALANDASSYDEIFKSQLEPLLESNDLVIAFTGSGNSKNILNAIGYANSNGAQTIAFTGFNGGKIKDLAKTYLIVPSDNMERIEDIHLMLEHLIHLYLLGEIQAGRLK